MMNVSPSSATDDFMEERSPVLTRAIGLAVALAATTGLLLVVTTFALLKEDPMFWRNAGGWPIWLRGLVKLTFYPLFAGEICVLLLLSAVVVGSPALARWRRALWPLTGLLWAWTGAISLLVMGNNLANLLAGRPLHWHPF